MIIIIKNTLETGWGFIDNSLGVDQGLQASTEYLDEECGGFRKLLVAWVKKIVKHMKCKEMNEEKPTFVQVKNVIYTFYFVYNTN